MDAEFDLIHNYHERAVFAAVRRLAASHPAIAGDAGLLADVACVALNRLPPRYIRHDVDFIFYLSDKERVETVSAVEEAARSAIAFVESRLAAPVR